MTFTVLWKPEAEAELAQIWTDAPDRVAVANAADLIDAALRADPLAVSRPRTNDFRVKFVPPLGVQFQVRGMDCQVLVVDVWRTHRPFEQN